MGIALRLIASVLDGFVPTACLECGDRAEGPNAPICSRCCGRLPWWRAIDGCPRCGFAGGALATLDDFETTTTKETSPVTGACGTADRFTLAEREFEAAADAPCPGCYAEGSALDASHTLLRYVDSPRAWIPQFKHHNSPFGPPLESRLAVEFYASELGRLLASRIGIARLQPPDVILPIPLHPRRRRQRGFNQSQSIAAHIGQALGISVSTRTLLRVRDTPAQAFLDASARRANLRRAFGLSAGSALPSRVWLVDDVLTTGATLESAAETLLLGGADEVRAITLAATPPGPWPRSKRKRDTERA